MIWNHNLEDIIRGWTREGDDCICLVCGQRFEQGRIYPLGDAFYDAQGAVKKHVQDAHGGMADDLLRREAGEMGLTDIQHRLLQMIAAGKGDAEMAQEMGIAQSTVRNHRFKLREKEKQAKMFLALMGALEQHAAVQSEPAAEAEAPAPVRSVDAQYGITEEKRRKTIDSCFDKSTGTLRQIPAREKKKIIVLTEIMKNFKPGQPYSEAEVNHVLKRIYEPDYVSLRRYLIEYVFMDRSDDCRVYRVKE